MKPCLPGVLGAGLTFGSAGADGTRPLRRWQRARKFGAMVRFAHRLQKDISEVAAAVDTRGAGTGGGPDQPREDD